MKFQDPNIHGSKVKGGIKKCDERKDRITEAQAESNMPHQRFQSLGHN